MATNRRRSGQRRRRPRSQTYTYQGISVAAGTLTDTADGTAARVTNLTDVIEQTIAQPDIELNRALLTRVRGQWTAQPDDTTLRTYSFGLILAPFSLDAADIDPGVVGAMGLNWWLTKDYLITGQTITSDDATPEFRAVRGRYTTRGVRRMRGFGMSLLLVERVQGADLDNVAHIMDITVALP